MQGDAGANMVRKDSVVFGDSVLVLVWITLLAT